MKKISLIIIFITLIFLVTACDNENEVVSNGTKVNTSQMTHKHCTREGQATGIDVDLNYDIYYTDDILNILKSEEKVTSDDEEKLKTYEEAYKGIHEHYKGLEYYDAKVVTTANSVTSTITINYDKIDIDRLIEIEGEEDNIFENKKAKVDKWLTLAKKFGTKCKLVEEE